MTSEPLRTLLFCTSYMDSPDAWRRRYERWVDYYARIPLARSATVLIDDASSYLPEDPRLTVGDELPASIESSPFHLYRFPNRLGRGTAEEQWAHWGWWRSFLFSVKIARRYGYRKIIHVESDAYLLSRAIVDYINRLDAGWTTFWCPRHAMPEAGIQIIAEDQFPAMEHFTEIDVRTLARMRAENALPFTHVNKSFVGNRYGEYRRTIPGYADFACQIDPVALSVAFRDSATNASA